MNEISAIFMTIYRGREAGLWVAKLLYFSGVLRLFCSLLQLRFGGVLQLDFKLFLGLKFEALFGVFIAGL